MFSLKSWSPGEEKEFRVLFAKLKNEIVDNNYTQNHVFKQTAMQTINAVDNWLNQQIPVDVPPPVADEQKLDVPSVDPKPVADPFKAPAPRNVNPLPPGMSK